MKVLLLSSFGLSIESMQQTSCINKLNIPLSLKFISALKLTEKIDNEPQEYVKKLSIPEELKPYLLITGALNHIVPESNDDSLVLAIGQRINDCVIELINRGIDLSYGLGCAALCCNTEAIKLLLKAGADVNFVYRDGNTALTLVIDSDTEKMIREENERHAHSESSHFKFFFPIPTATEKEEMIELLLKAGADPTIKGKRGKYALDLAAMAGNKGIVKLLLSKGAPFSDLTLVEMAQKGYTKIAKLLIKAGADVNGQRVINARGVYGNTALIEAAANGNDKLLKVLLDYGAYVNLGSNYNNNTALYYAVCNGSKKSIELLLSHNANVNSEGVLSNSILAQAAKRGDADIVKLLLEGGADVNAQSGWHDGTALIWAAAQGHRDVVTLLLDHGADSNAANSEGSTALVVAATNGHKEITQLLLKRDANHNSKAKFQALAGAISKEQVEIVKLLLSTGIDFCYQNNESDIKALRNGLLGLIAEFNFFSCLSNNTDKDSADMLLLKLAIILGNKEIIEMLIPYIDFQKCSFIALTFFLNSLYNAYQNPDLVMPNKVSKVENEEIVGLITAYIANIQDSNGDTPLMIAARLGLITLVEKLIEKGAADMQLQNNNGLTALTVAVIYDRKEIANLCINKETRLDQRAVERLLRIAALNNSLEVAKLLLEHNVNVNSFDSQGNTPLMIAVKACAIDIVKLLLDHNAHVNRQDNKGYTALMELMSANQSNSAHIRKEIASLLLNKGADASLKNDEGKTALDLAIDKDDSLIVNLLMYYKAKESCTIC